MNIAIIDDVQQDLDALAEAAREHYDQRQISIQLHTFSSPEDFWNSYSPGSYDLIFLDIYIKQANGMDWAAQVRVKDDAWGVVVGPGSAAVAVASDDVQAAYYLLMPLYTNKLTKFFDSIHFKREQDTRYIEVICDRTLLRVPVKSILYADTFHNAVQLHTDAGVLRTYLTFQKFEELIHDLPCFLSCYRGCLVNMDRIYKTLEEGFLLDNQETVQIRKRGANAIKKEYLNYLFS